MAKSRETLFLTCYIIFSGTMLSNLTEVPFIKIGDYTLEFELGPPSPELQEVAKKELRESPEIQKQSMARLQELLKGSALNVKDLIN